MVTFSKAWPSAEQVETFSSLNKRKRLEVDAQKFVSRLKPIRNYFEVNASPESVFGVFQVLKSGQVKHAGMAMKFRRLNGTSVLSWVKLQDLSRMTEEMIQRFSTVARKHEIPRYEYSKYPFLNALEDE